MALDRVRVSSVRCVRTADIELHPQRNYFFGPNGAGKTSLLEAIHLLGRGRSFRTRQTALLVSAGAAELGVLGEIQDLEGRRTLTVRFREGLLEVQIGGVAAGTLVELARAFPVHVLDPQLHELIEGGPTVRRRYLDAGVFHVEPTYLESWRRYRRALAQRNSALRRGASDSQLAAWTQGLVPLAREIHTLRERYVSTLAASLQGIGRRLTGGEIGIDYRPGWRRGTGLTEALREVARRDRETGFTQVGPHRADLKVTLEERGVRDAASRGQQKLVAAALVLAQVATFSARAGQGGTLLVDDPAAELDGTSLGRLLAELAELEAQLIVTGLSKSALAPPAGYPVFHVEQGRIQPVL